MTHVKFRNTFTEDDRWLDAGPTAFAVHVSACCYSDAQLTDGAISKARVRRVALTLGVGPDEAEEAAERLVELGFWAATENGFQIVGYAEPGPDQIGFSKEETERMRTGWAADKRWRRRHNNGNHDLCPPGKCPAAAEVRDRATEKPGTASGKDKPNVRKGQRKSPSRKTAMSRPLDQTRPDPTRPDRKGGEGKGKGKQGGSASGMPARSARRAPSAPPPGGRSPVARSSPSGEPLCKHAVPDGLTVGRDGRFTCRECEAIAPHPERPEFKRWVTPELLAYVEENPINCRNPSLGRVAASVAEEVWHRTTPKTASNYRLLQAWAVDRLEPGRVDEVLANGTPHREEDQ